MISLKVGFFLAYRQIRRANFWVSFLIIFVMTVTFLNLVVVSGILVGLITGSSNDFRNHYSGDVLIKTDSGFKNITGTRDIISAALAWSGTEALSVRYLEGVRVESDYKQSVSGNQSKRQVATVLAGIDPTGEKKVSALDEFLVEGEYLESDDANEILIGSSLLEKYSDAFADNTLPGVEIGSKLRLDIDGSFHEVIVKGIVKIKVGEVNQKIFMNSKQMRRITKRSANLSNEIAVKVKDTSSPKDLKIALQASNLDESALIQDWEEAQGEFFKDLSRTFSILGNVIGAIGLAVASVTIFIVIFINAISRKKFIGILKGIGISGNAIRFSYIFQSIFYAGLGSSVGLLLLYGLLAPYFDSNPIDFPFSDGILAVSLGGTVWRLALLFLSTLVAGFVPAQIIIRRNTLDSILGR